MTSAKAPWPIVFMLCATATASYICRVNVSYAGAALMEDFHLTQIEMGRIFSIFLLGYAFFQVPSGVLSDRIGARRLLSIASFLWVGLTLVQAFIGSPIWPMESMSYGLIALMACRLVLGIVESPTYTASAEGISRWVPVPFQGRANGIVISSIGLGSAIAPLLVSSIMVASGWRIALLCSCIPALIVAIVWLFLREPPQANTARTSSQNSTRFKPSRSFVLLTISYTLQGYVGYIFVSWFYLYLVQERHFGLLSGAWMSSLPWVLSIVSIPLGGYISDRLSAGSLGRVWGNRIVPMVGLGLSGILISVGAHTESAIVAGIALAFATALVLCVEGPFWATMMAVSGKSSGAAGGIMNMGSNVGGLISPALTPVLAAMIGWENALHIAAGLSVVGAVLWLGISRLE